MDSQPASHMKRQRGVTIDTGRGIEDSVREIEQAIVRQKSAGERL